MSRLPNFFLAGAPKAGTTSIYHYLDQHPGVFMSAIKEPHYFAEEIREENMDPGTRRAIAAGNRELRDYLAGDMRAKRFGGIVPEWNDYVRLFANARRQTALGEASVCYLWSPTAPARIAEKLPQAKILLMLRNPVDRAYSQYLHGLSSGAIRWSFREHVNRNLRHESTQISVHYPFLEFGLYAEQLSDELGGYNGIEKAGYLQSFLFRAARLVVDTGIHTKRWSREQATDYMVQTTGFARPRSQREVERYCTQIGQACSYKVGHTAWTRARDEARKTLGARFDIKQFHEVLSEGAMPLSILERRIRERTTIA